MCFFPDDYSHMVLRVFFSPDGELDKGFVLEDGNYSVFVVNDIINQSFHLPDLRFV